MINSSLILFQEEKISSVKHEPSHNIFIPGSQFFGSRFSTSEKNYVMGSTIQVKGLQSSLKLRPEKSLPIGMLGYWNNGVGIVQKSNMHRPPCLSTQGDIRFQTGSIPAA